MAKRNNNIAAEAFLTAIRRDSSGAEKKPLSAKKKKAVIGLGAVALIALVVLGVCVGGLVGAARGARAGEPGTDDVSGNLASLKAQVSTLKDDLKGVLASLAEQDTEAAYTGTMRVRQDTSTLRSVLSRPIWQMAENLPLVGSEVRDAQELLGMVDQSLDSILIPVIRQMESVPLSDITAGDGFNVNVIYEYLDFLPTLVPAADAFSEELAGIDLHLVDSEGKLDEYREKLSSLLGAYHEMEEYIPLLKVILGQGIDRFYIFAAQNSAEIRASGGFPGAVGSIQIVNGIMTIGDFVTVYDVFTELTPNLSWITPEESLIFTDKLAVPRDADYCPDFERVGKVWAMAYHEQMCQRVDGVISMTPTIVQKLLAFLGEITLSDGTVLDGTNATRVLQHQIYYDYLAEDGAKYNGGDFWILDAFWIEAARALMHLVTENFSPAQLGDYVRILREGTADRTIMVWMADAGEQTLVRSLGWSGGLNSNPIEPEAGIYYSCADASKLGWYVGLYPECSEPIKNPDGSYSYDITLTLVNRIDDNTIRRASWYIIGSNGGCIVSNLHLYAPAGGTISNVQNDGGYFFTEGYDADLQLYYANHFLLYPQKPLTVTYRVTTSSWATEPLKFSVTPTLQEYWE